MHSTPRVIVVLFALIMVLVTGMCLGQDDISTIPFDAISNATVNGGGSAISLEADTTVAGSVTATGQVTSAEGFRFPDATVQTTAAAGASSTANLGLYSNTIADLIPPNAYTEVCIKGGAVLFDIHAASESTSGGNCIPGDTGWIIERFERDAGAQVTWFLARLECLKDEMRLPEPFESVISCDNAAELAISDMADNWEWSSNQLEGDVTGGNAVFVTAMVMGSGSCFAGAQGAAASSGAPATYTYRCVR